MAHDVFVSYANEDKATADALVATLEQHQIRCWIAPRDVLPGQDYAEMLIEAIGAARVMVLVFSANANNSPHVMREVERAASKGIAILPLRIEDVVPSRSMEFFISSTHWLDALTPPLERHLQQLADTVQLLLSKGARPAPVEKEPVGDVSAPTAETAGAAGRGRPPPWQGMLEIARQWGGGSMALLALGAGAIAVVTIIVLVALLRDGGNGGNDTVVEGNPSPEPNGELTLEEYFQDLDAIFVTIESDLERLETELDLELERAVTEADSVAAGQRFFSDLEETVREGVDDMKSINPPSLVREAHDNFIAIEVEALGFFAAINDRAQRASSADQFGEIATDAEGPAFEDIIEREEGECLILQAIADDNGIDVDLECENEDELTLEEYFQAIELLAEGSQDRYERGQEEQFEALQEAETVQEISGVYGDFNDRFLPPARVRFSAWESIEPPSGVEDAHNELVAVFAESLELLEDVNERAQSVESASDLESLQASFEDPVVADIYERSEQACFALEAIAGENSIGVDLECAEAGLAR